MRAAALALAGAAVMAGQAAAASAPEPERAVAMLNEWRATVGVGPVAHDPAMSDGCRLHADYARQNPGTAGHYEEPGRPGYTDAGNAAAAASVLAYGTLPATGPYLWEHAPYHRTGLLRPRLTTSGFWHESGLACMGVAGGPEGPGLPALAAYPYPYAGQAGVPTSFACDELPNPCLQVPGNAGRTPTGFIATVQFNGPWGPYEYGPLVTAASLAPDGGAPVAITVEDRDDPRAANLDGGLSVIPHAPLRPATAYTAHVAGTFGYPQLDEGGFDTGVVVEAPFDVTWRFTTAATAGASPRATLPAPPRLRAVRRVGPRTYRIAWLRVPGATRYVVRTTIGARRRVTTTRNLAVTVRTPARGRVRVSVAALGGGGVAGGFTSVRIDLRR